MELSEMGADDLWALHMEVGEILRERIEAEKAELEKRLKLLNGRVSERRVPERRPYPPVLPKYRNPDRPSETWSGRGKQPRWLVAQLKSGKRVDDFAIRKVTNKRK